MKFRQETFKSLHEVFESKVGSITATTDKRYRKYDVFVDIANKYVDKIGDSIIPISDTLVHDTITKMLASDLLMGVMLDGNNVVCGGFVANKGHLSLYDITAVSMEYFNTSEKGIRAVNATLAAHNVLIKYATKKEIGVIISNCYYKDEKHMLNKILARHGWKSCGYMSVYNVKEAVCHKQ